jgi:hypothetical protein
MSKDIKKEEEVKEMVEVEVASMNIIKVLDAFLQQEMGNKVSQFNIQGLSQLMLVSLTSKEE